MLEYDGKHSYSIVDICLGGRKAVISLNFRIDFGKINQKESIIFKKILFTVLNLA